MATFVASHLAKPLDLFVGQDGAGGIVRRRQKKHLCLYFFRKRLAGVSIWKVGAVTDSLQSDICSEYFYAPRATYIVRVDRLNDLVDVDGKVGPPGDIDDLDIVELPKKSGWGAVTWAKRDMVFALDSLCVADKHR